MVAIKFTLATTLIFGIIYPLVVTGLAQLLFHDRANGQLIEKDGKIVGPGLIGQKFTSPRYFHSRPSEAGNEYDAGSSGSLNLGPTNLKLIDRVKADVEKLRARSRSVVIADLRDCRCFLPSARFARCRTTMT